MMNSVLAAVKTFFQEVVDIDGNPFGVLDNNYASAMDSTDEENPYRISSNILPAVIMNFESGSIKTQGSNFIYEFPGRIFVAVAEMNIETADYYVKKYTFDPNYVYHKILSKPKPNISGNYIVMIPGIATPKPFRGTEETHYYLSYQIPLRLEYRV